MFRALADPSRRLLLDMLHERAAQTLSELCDGLKMRRQSVSQHLALLEAANLVTTLRDGRRKLHYLNAVPIHQIQQRWIWKFEEPHLAALDAITRHAEERAMSSLNPIPDYMYTTYIRATPEQVWEALTDADTSGQYWGHSQVSTWQIGSRVDHVRTDGSGIADASGRVVVFDPPRRLAFGFDDPAQFDADDPTFEPSLVTFDIEPGQGIVKLTVTHTGLASEEDLRDISQGWPAVLANLKTWLETGEVLPQEPWAFHAEDRAAQMAKHD